MRFDLIDWALLVLVSAVVAVAMHLSKGSLTMLARPEALPLLVMGVIFFVLNAYATWLILRNCVDGLELGKWLLVNVLGGLLAVGVLLASPAFPPGRAGFTAMFLWWLSIFAAGIAYYCPPGFLLQRLSGINAWPFVIAGAASALISPLIGLTVPPLGRGGLGIAWGVLIGLGLGAISGLSLGAGLFLMGRRADSARTAE